MIPNRINYPSEINRSCKQQIIIYVFVYVEVGLEYPAYRDLCISSYCSQQLQNINFPLIVKLQHSEFTLLHSSPACICTSTQKRCQSHIAFHCHCVLEVICCVHSIRVRERERERHNAPHCWLLCLIIKVKLFTLEATSFIAVVADQQLVAAVCQGLIPPSVVVRLTKIPLSLTALTLSWPAFLLSYSLLHNGSSQTRIFVALCTF